MDCFLPHNGRFDISASEIVENDPKTPLKKMPYKLVHNTSEAVSHTKSENTETRHSLFSCTAWPRPDPVCFLESNGAFVLLGKK